jgi:hypothetical protein
MITVSWYHDKVIMLSWSFYHYNRLSYFFLKTSHTEKKESATKCLFNSKNSRPLLVSFMYSRIQGRQFGWLFGRSEEKPAQPVERRILAANNGVSMATIYVLKSAPRSRSRIENHEESFVILSRFIQHTFKFGFWGQSCWVRSLFHLKKIQGFITVQ